MLLDGFNLIGLSLGKKTSNANGQSALDCGSLWQRFESGHYANNIPGKLGDEIIAVYHEYEGDHTKPFSYFIGCKVMPGTALPAGMDRLAVPAGSYHSFTAKGEIPGCIADTWKRIWNSDLPRAYRSDFEVYGERSKDWSDAEVDIFISI